MPTYELLCDKCRKIHERVYTITQWSDPKNKNEPCPDCGKPMEQTFTEAPGLTFKEGMDVESSKPGSYWRNAEKVKQEHIRKQVEIEKEKLAYGDKPTREKYKRQIDNLNRMEE